MKRFKVALVLGGGGARGFAHIGVLRALKLADLQIDLIVGSSMGAIIGASYALNLDINFIENKVQDLIESRSIKQLEVFLGSSEPEEKKILIGRFLEILKSIYLWNVSRSKKWLIDASALMDVTRPLVPDDKKFIDTQIPFACVAADLLRGTSVILKEGNLLEAVLASCSLPGVFPPIEIDNQQLIDGGMVSPVPALEAKKLGVDFIIGVNVEGLRLREDFKSGVDIILQADQIKAYHFGRMNLDQCDFLISPEVTSLSWADFSKADFCVKKGFEAAQNRITSLKQAISEKKRKTFLKRLVKFQI